MPLFWILTAFIALAAIIMYNTLIGRKNQVENIYGSLDALLKKRFDLIPNLVASVEEYMKHEEGVLTRITELRSQALNPSTHAEEKLALSNELSQLLSGIMVAVENYPLLKASDNFLYLQSTLTEIEEQISAARRAYNQVITDYNNSVQMFPTSLMAALMGYTPKQLLSTPIKERENINVASLFKDR